MKQYDDYEDAYYILYKPGMVPSVDADDDDSASYQIGMPQQDDDHDVACQLGMSQYEDDDVVVAHKLVMAQYNVGGDEEYYGCVAYTIGMTHHADGDSDDGDVADSVGMAQPDDWDIVQNDDGVA